MTNASLKKTKTITSAAETDSFRPPASQAQPADHPDVWIFPPVLPLGALALAFALEWFFPWAGEPFWLPGSLRKILGAMFLVVGFALLVTSRRAMMRAQTNVDPRQPALHLVQVFPFTWTRNPMYLGGNLACVGLSAICRLHWMLVLFPIIAAICHYGIVLREEDYLERKFGADYATYQRRVRRWF